MRISDWSSDVCSSDLGDRRESQDGRLSPFRASRNGARTGGPAATLSRRRSLGRDHLRLCRGPELGHGRRQRPYAHGRRPVRSEEHTSELQSLMRISYAVFCLKKKKKITHITQTQKRERGSTKNKKL